MRNYVTWLFLVLILSGCASPPQSPVNGSKAKQDSEKEIILASSKELVNQFFGPDGIKNKKEVYAGEMLERYVNQPTFGEGLPPGMKVDIRELDASARRKVYAVLLSKGGISEDWYIYLINDNSKWKITSLRTLALPGFFFMVVDELKEKPNKTAEEESQYQNMLLTNKLDSELKVFLQSNIEQLDTISKEAKINPENATKITESLFLNFVKYESETGIVDVNIGGILDNSVGYLHVPETATVPSMSADNYIYIERLQGNWYLYKTT